MSEDGELAGSPLLPVAQERVLNAVKHAAPTAIEVTVETRDQQLVLKVNDDGVGIGTARSPRPRRRVEDAVGAFEIETRADGGTRSRVTLPERRKAPG
jgi:signal transduction histidine kinase